MVLAFFLDRAWFSHARFLRNERILYGDVVAQTRTELVAVASVSKNLSASGSRTVYDRTAG